MLVIDSAGKIVATAPTSDNQERDFFVHDKKLRGTAAATAPKYPPF